MQAGVCQWVFNARLTAGEMNMLDCIRFVGEETVADCFEPLSRYWNDDERDPIEDQAEAARTLLDQVGLLVSCYTLESDFAVYDDDQFEETVANCILEMDIAEILDTDTIRLDPRTSLPADHAERPDLDFIIERMAEGMQEIADVAEGRGMIVGVENHGLLLGRSDLVMRLIEAVDRPNFGVNLDFSNFRIVFGEDHVEVTRMFAPFVVHVHAKDSLLSATEPENAGDRARSQAEGWRRTLAKDREEWYKPCVGGAGDMQWPLVFSILREAGFDGTVSLETSLAEDILGSVREGVANLTRILGEVESE